MLILLADPYIIDIKVDAGFQNNLAVFIPNRLVGRFLLIVAQRFGLGSVDKLEQVSAHQYYQQNPEEYQYISFSRCVHNKTAFPQ